MNMVRAFARQIPFVTVALLGALLGALGSVACGGDDDELVGGQGGASGSVPSNGAGSGSGGASVGQGGAGAGGTAGGSGGAAGASGASGAGGGGAGAAGQAGGGAGGSAGQGGGSGGAAGGSTFCSSGVFVFCSDFDDDAPLEPSTRGWDTIKPNAGVIEVATDLVVSSPRALHVAASDPGLAPTLVKMHQVDAGDPIADATFEYDVYLHSLSAGGDGGVAISDLQFDAGGQFGFRLVVAMTEGGDRQEIRLEHENAEGGTADVVAGASLPLDAWSHVRFGASFFDDGDGAGPQVYLQAYLNDLANPAFEAFYAAPFDAAPAVGVSLVPFDLGKGYSFYLDNLVLRRGPPMLQRGGPPAP
jgi:hypothetical protein